MSGFIADADSLFLQQVPDATLADPTAVFFGMAGVSLALVLSSTQLALLTHF